MGSLSDRRTTKHAVLVPLPTAGHINPLLKLARVLHSRGFYITFFISEQIRRQQLAATAQCDESHPSPSLHPLYGFRIEVVSHGLPPSCSTGPEFLRELNRAVRTTYIDEVRQRLSKLYGEVPPVTCVIGGLLGPALLLAEELRIPGFLFWTTSACGFLPTLHAKELVTRGYVAPQGPRRDCVAHLDRVVDWIPGMLSVRVRDMSSKFFTSDPEDINLQFDYDAALWASRASGGVILNTFKGLEHDAIQAMRSQFKRLFVIGPLSSILDSMGGDNIPSIEISLWSDNRRYFQWLDTQAVNSVLYINFGSIVTMGFQQLSELILGVVNSGVPFLWVIRPDIMDKNKKNDGYTILNKVLELLSKEKQQDVSMRGFFTQWCSQEEVLAHPGVGGFLTHAGWNSMSESMQNGIPMICKPFIFDQPLNCRYACEEWGVAMKLADNFSSDEVEFHIRDLMFGIRGKILRENAEKWKNMMSQHAGEGGPSYQDMDALINSCTMVTTEDD